MEYRVTSIEKTENEGYREVLVTLNNGTEIHIAACHESWEQWGGTTEELYTTVDVAELYNEWLHGGDEPDESDIEIMVRDLNEPNFDTELLDHDIYYVEINNNGEKQVNVQRYYYLGDDGYKRAEFVGIRKRVVSPINKEEVETEEGISNQYVSDVTEDDIAHDFADIHLLPIEEVNEDTPCGKYIDKY